MLKKPVNAGGQSIDLSFTIISKAFRISVVRSRSDGKMFRDKIRNIIKVVPKHPPPIFKVSFFPDDKIEVYCSMYMLLINLEATRENFANFYTVCLI